MIKGILLKMVHNDSSNEPCIISGLLVYPSSPDTIPAVQSQIHVGLYVNNFVFYYSDPTNEALFKTLLQEHIKVNFMGDFEYL